MSRQPEGTPFPLDDIFRLAVRAELESREKAGRDDGTQAWLANKIEATEAALSGLLKTTDECKSVGKKPVRTSKLVLPICEVLEMVPPVVFHDDPELGNLVRMILVLRRQLPDVLSGLAKSMQNAIDMAKSLKESTANAVRPNYGTSGGTSSPPGKKGKKR